MSHIFDGARFDRKYRLRIATNPDLFKSSTKEKIDGETSGGAAKKPTNTDSLSIDREAIQITDLHIIASIVSKVTKKAVSAPARIDIYNLSRETLEKILPEATIILEAGYSTDKELPVVFAGQVVSVSTTRRGVDKVTTLMCSSAYSIIKNVRIEKTFKKGISYKELIQEILEEASAWGLPLGHFKTDPQEDSKEVLDVKNKIDLTLDDGYNASGNLVKILADIANSIGYRAYISLGKLYVEPKEISKTLEVIELDSTTIIGDVQLRNNASGKLSGTTTNKQGISVQLLLDGRLSLDKKVKLTTDYYAGVYDIVKVDHKMAYEDADWFTTLDLTYLGSVK